VVRVTARLNMLLISHVDNNHVVLWDLTAERALKLDFTQELVNMDKKKSKMVRLLCAALCGCSTPTSWHPTLDSWHPTLDSLHLVVLACPRPALFRSYLFRSYLVVFWLVLAPRTRTPFLLLSSWQTSIAFDDARSVLFAGHNDGSIFVRKLERTPSGALGVKILRFCDPAKTATTPSRITCMSYDSLLDRLYTGDMSGLSRIVKKVSGVPYEATEVGTRAVSDGTFRARRGSLATGEDAL
jgi:hypothetical protein